MSLFVCKWKKEFDSTVKKGIREDICAGFANLTGIDGKYFAVLFDDYVDEDFPDGPIGVLVLIYQTEGRDISFKEKEVAIITEAFCKYTGWDSSRISILINDIQKGSMATKGKIVNLGGAAACAIKNKELDI